jgi:cyclopropane fatty-acyl-phospholipid synthase-like methyltransferase
MTETIENKRDWHIHWNTVGDRAGPREFLSQVERTIGGRPIDDKQIMLAVEAARAALDLTESDCLLDLCCGNGLLTVRLAAACQSTYAVDFSKYLIEVARRYHIAPTLKYIHCSVIDLTVMQLNGRYPNKISMITALQYFTEANLKRLLDSLSGLRDSSATLYFSDVPDIDRLRVFYDTPERRADFECRWAAGIEAVGTWWSRRDLAEVLAGHGYSAEFRNQDSHRFGAHYRFDLLARYPRRLD